MDVAGYDVFALRSQPSFLPAFALRTGTNLMNAATCAGFGHWGNRAYMLQYVSPENGGMVLTNELAHLHNLASVFDETLSTPSALIFAGESYARIYEQLKAAVPTARHGKKGFLDFWHVYRKADLPIYLLACNETGARQLALMRQGNYAAKIARAAFGDRWTPRDPAIPEADGCVDGSPLLIAADMDLRRAVRVQTLARQQRRQELMLAALPEQLREIYAPLLPGDGATTLLAIEKPVLQAAFGKEFSLNELQQAESGGEAYG
jgi:hypothetical protein